MSSAPKDLAAATDEQLRHRITTGSPIEAPSTAASGPAAWKVEGAGALLEQTWRGIGEPVRRMATGLERLDDFLGGGFAVPSVVLLGAGPKSAKSTIASAIAENHVAAGGTALVIDLENGARRWARRLLMRQTRIGEARLTRAAGEPVLTREEFERLEAFPRMWGAEGELGRRLVRFPDRLLGTLRPDTIGALFAATVAHRDGLAARQLADPAMPALLVIDSIQKLPGSLENRRDTIDGWIRAIEAARLAHPETVALVISELARRTNGEGFGGFKESNGLEYTADLALKLELLDKDAPPRDGPAPWPGRRLRLRAEHNRDGDSGPAVIVHTLQPWHGLEETAEDPRDDATAASSTSSDRPTKRRKSAPGSHASRTAEDSHEEPWRS
jgi:hypothetical protein